MNYQDNVPIKPNIQVPVDPTTPRLRPGNDVKASRNFRKALAERQSNHLPDENEEIPTEKSEQLPSLFELSSSKKSTSKSGLNAETKANFQSNVESQTPSATSFSPKGKAIDRSSTYKGDFTGKSDLTEEISREDNKDKKLVDLSISDDSTDQESISIDEGETLQSLDNSSLQDKGVVRNKRFEIPSQPLHPDEEDMIALNEQKSLSLPTNVEGQSSHKDRFSLETQASLSATSHSASVDKNTSGKNKEKVKNSEASTSTDSELEAKVVSNLTSPLAAINATLLAENNHSVAKEIPPRGIVIRELINRVVEAIQVIKKEGLTETVVTLRHPPILEGTKLTLTTSDAMRNEFNIAFSSPNVQAQMFLDHKLTKDPLAQALENRGFVIHTITTETVTASINPPTPDAQQSYARDNQEREQRQRRQQQEEET